MEHCAKLLGTSWYNFHHIKICIDSKAPIIVKYRICGIVDCLISELDICLAYKVSKRFQVFTACKAVSNKLRCKLSLHIRILFGAENYDIR
jgi:hypothetical protein